MGWDAIVLGSQFVHVDGEKKTRSSSMKSFYWEERKQICDVVCAWGEAGGRCPESCCPAISSKEQHVLEKWECHGKAGCAFQRLGSQGGAEWLAFFLEPGADVGLKESFQLFSGGACVNPWEHNRHAGPMHLTWIQLQNPHFSGCVPHHSSLLSCLLVLWTILYGVHFLIGPCEIFIYSESKMPDCYSLKISFNLCHFFYFCVFSWLYFLWIEKKIISVNECEDIPALRYNWGEGFYCR